MRRLGFRPLLSQRVLSSVSCLDPVLRTCWSRSFAMACGDREALPWCLPLTQHGRRLSSHSGGGGKKKDKKAAAAAGAATTPKSGGASKQSAASSSQAAAGPANNGRGIDGDFVFGISDVSKVLPGGRVLFKNANLMFQRGAKVGILGSNGSGKSSLLKILAKVDRCEGLMM